MLASQKERETHTDREVYMFRRGYPGNEGIRSSAREQQKYAQATKTSVSDRRGAESKRRSLDSIIAQAAAVMSSG
jgi:hypothetical protein